MRTFNKIAVIVALLFAPVSAVSAQGNRDENTSFRLCPKIVNGGIKLVPCWSPGQNS